MDGLKLVDDYVKWYRDNTIVSNFDQYSMITTPFVNHLNDRIRLYIESLSNGKIRISDDGETLNELELFGIDLTTKTRASMVSSILSQFGIQRKGNILFIESQIENFAKSKHKLVETIIRFYDISFTKKQNIVQLFAEEVQQYFYEHDFGGTANVKLTGASGIDYQVDYVIGETKKSPERLIQTVNQFTFDRFTTYNYIFNDVSLARTQKKEPKKIIIFNDDLAKPQTKALLGAESEHVLVLPWSNKKEIEGFK